MGNLIGNVTTMHVHIVLLNGTLNRNPCNVYNLPDSPFIWNYIIYTIAKRNKKKESSYWPFILKCIL